MPFNFIKEIPIPLEDKVIQELQILLQKAGNKQTKG